MKIPPIRPQSLILNSRRPLPTQEPSRRPRKGSLFCKMVSSCDFFLSCRSGPPSVKSAVCGRPAPVCRFLPLPSHLAPLCHGLSRDMSRVQTQKTPVNIDLSRCHGCTGGRGGEPGRANPESGDQGEHENNDRLEPRPRPAHADGGKEEAITFAAGSRAATRRQHFGRKLLEMWRLSSDFGAS
jgi:hypothetical protein